MPSRRVAIPAVKIRRLHCISAMALPENCTASTSIIALLQPSWQLPNLEYQRTHNAWHFADQLRSIERVFDCRDDAKVGGDGYRPIVAYFNARASWANIVAGIRQASAHKWRKIIDLMDPNIARIIRTTLHLPTIEHGHPS